MKGFIGGNRLTPLMTGRMRAFASLPLLVLFACVTAGLSVTDETGEVDDTWTVRGADVSAATGDVALRLDGPKVFRVEVDGENGLNMPESELLCVWRFRDWRRRETHRPPRALLQTKAPYAFGLIIRWDATGRKLAFKTYCADLSKWGGWINAIDVESGACTTYAKDQDPALSPDFPHWSPDGKLLAYVSRRTPLPSPTRDVMKLVRVVDVASGSVSAVPETPLPVWDSWAWGADSGMMFCTFGQEDGIWSVDVKTGAKDKLVSGHAMSQPASAPPDGDAFFYLDLGKRGTGKSRPHLELMRREASGWESVPVQDSEGNWLSGFGLIDSVWLPGGKSFLVLWTAESGQGQTQIGTFSKEGRALKQFPFEISDERVLALRAISEEEAICVTSNWESGELKVDSISLKTGEATALLKLGQDELKRLGKDSKAPTWKPPADKKTEGQPAA